MIELWPQWLRPAWLLLLPLLGWLLWKLWHRQKRAGRWQMILPAAFHAVLLGGGKKMARAISANAVSILSPFTATRASGSMGNVTKDTSHNSTSASRRRPLASRSALIVR